MRTDDDLCHFFHHIKDKLLLVLRVFIRNFLILILLCAYALGDERQEEGSQLIKLQSYNPMYFLMGEPDTKIQVSFKARLIEGDELYFGYSQLMMWELFRASPYFRDLNYNPEFFYRFFISGESKRWIDFGPIEHESNGKGGVDERSWNRTYIRYHSVNSVSVLEQNSMLIWSLKAWVPYWENSSNTDIAQYRGVWEAEITLSELLSKFVRADDLTLRLYPGGPSFINPFLGGQELTFRISFPNATKFLSLVTFQIFHGYGENLYNYKDNRLGIRAGLAF